MARQPHRTVRQQRVAAARARQRRLDRRRNLVRGTVLGLVVMLAGAGIAVAAIGHTPSSSTATGPEGIALETGPVLAPATTAATGQAVDGIQCQATEQVAYHIHAHLAVYVDGKLRPVPIGIGVVAPAITTASSGAFAQATTCYYWLHVHAQDGIIHIESPAQKVYTLGDFFDIWRQPLTASQVGSATGTVTAYVNGTKYAGDVRTITLLPHEVIQLDVGAPVVSPKGVNWSGSSL